MTRRRPFPALVALVAALALAPAVAEAQFGGMLRRAAEKKAEDKAGESVGDRANAALLSDPVFDATTVEITDALLDTWVAARLRLTVQRAERQRAAEVLLQRSIATRDSADALENAADRRKHAEIDGKWERCRDATRQAQEDDDEKAEAAREARLAADPMAAQRDPELRKLIEVQKKMAAAMQRGDTATAAALQAQLSASMDAAEEAKTAKAVAARCGPRPPKPAWLVRQETLRARGDSLRRGYDGARAYQECPGGPELGLTPVQAAKLCERLRSWMNGMRRDAPVTTQFTRAEYDRLVARRGALKKAMAG